MTAQMNNQAKLVDAYLINEQTGQSWVLDKKGKNMIGRGSPNEDPPAIALFHPAISRHHALISCVNAGPSSGTAFWHLANFSEQGCLINGKKIDDSVMLKHGDRIQIGPYTLVLYDTPEVNQDTVEFSLMETVGQPSMAGNWDDQELTPLGSWLETVVMLAFLLLSLLIVLFCFVF